MRRETILASMVLLFIAGAAWAAPRYVVTDLGTLPGYTDIQPKGINSSGQIVGVANSSSGSSQAFLYSGGTMQGLGFGTSAANKSEAWGINDSGQVVGTVYDQDSGKQYSRIFLYSGGSMQIQPLRSGTQFAEGRGINGLGQVVGQDTVGIGWNENAVMISGGTPQIVGPPVNQNANAGGDFSSALGINDSGQVAGSWRSNNVQQAFLNTGGSMQYLGDSFGGNLSDANAINTIGQVVGEATKTTNYYQAYLYSSGSMTSIGALSGYPASYAYDINDSGVIVGSVGGSGTNRAFIDQNLVMTDLNTLIDPSSHWFLNDAIGINDAGQICGDGVNPSGQYAAYLLTPLPTPEPGTLALIASGAAVLVWHRWRGRPLRAPKGRQFPQRRAAPW